MALSEETCEVCRVGAPLVTEQELNELMPQIPHWQLNNDTAEQKVQRVFLFDDFIQAIDFTNKVAELAESVGHHPAILVEWGKVTVQWWTHKIQGLHRTDLIMAAKTDELLP